MSKNKMRTERKVAGSYNNRIAITTTGGGGEGGGSSGIMKSGQPKSQTFVSWGNIQKQNDKMQSVTSVTSNIERLSLEKSDNDQKRSNLNEMNDMKNVDDDDGWEVAGKSRKKMGPKVTAPVYRPQTVQTTPIPKKFPVSTAGSTMPRSKAISSKPALTQTASIVTPTSIRTASPPVQQRVEGTWGTWADISSRTANWDDTPSKLYLARPNGGSSSFDKNKSTVVGAAPGAKKARAQVKQSNKIMSVDQRHCVVCHNVYSIHNNMRSACRIPHVWALDSERPYTGHINLGGLFDNRHQHLPKYTYTLACVTCSAKAERKNIQGGGLPLISAGSAAHPEKNGRDVNGRPVLAHFNLKDTGFCYTDKHRHIVPFEWKKNNSNVDSDTDVSPFNRTSCHTCSPSSTNCLRPPVLLNPTQPVWSKDVMDYCQDGYEDDGNETRGGSRAVNPDTWWHD